MIIIRTIIALGIASILLAGVVLAAPVNEVEIWNLDESADPSYHAFIINLGTPSSPLYEVQHGLCQESPPPMYFVDWRDLVRFLRQNIKGAPPSSSGYIADPGECDDVTGEWEEFDDFNDLLAWLEANVR